MAKKKEVNYIWGTGRRKTSVARVRLLDGSGSIQVNKVDVDTFFGTRTQRQRVRAALKAVGGEKSFDIFVRVHGGGYSGQADAISLGIARALLKQNPENEAILREGKFLTRDSREVERKKPGQKGARKSFQFSKR
ncbi:MAG: 30S ribosomal protein S9 [Planctomycetes bacterium]|nr:30S ribosomal protein S9 [Planctomycetota bacterium]